jgi:hypothetical protein
VSIDKDRGGSGRKRHSLVTMVIFVSLSASGVSEVPNLTAKLIESTMPNKIVMLTDSAPIEVTSVFSTPTKIAGILKKQSLNKVSDIRLVTLFQCGTSVIYVRADEKEYAIPLNSENVAKMTSEKLYPINDMIGLLQSKD